MTTKICTFCDKPNTTFLVAAPNDAAFICYKCARKIALLDRKSDGERAEK